MSHVEKLNKIIRNMKRVELNKFVSKINHELKISNATKLKRADLESQLLMKAHIIIPLIDSDKELKLFSTETKKRVKYISKEEEKEITDELKSLSKKIKKEKDETKRPGLIKRYNELSTKLRVSEIREEGVKETKKEAKKEILKPVNKEEIKRKANELTQKLLKAKDPAERLAISKLLSELRNM